MSWRDDFLLFRATVHIQVNDINEYSPVFKEKSYKATVIEGKKYDSILKVEAVDADCSFQFSQICNYEIVTPDVPFTIDKDGEDSHLADLCRKSSSWDREAAVFLALIIFSIDPCQHRSHQGCHLQDNVCLLERSARLVVYFQRYDCLLCVVKQNEDRVKAGARHQGCQGSMLCW